MTTQAKAINREWLEYWSNVLSVLIEAVGRFEDETGLAGSPLHEARKQVKDTVRRFTEALAEIESAEANE